MIASIIKRIKRLEDYYKQDPLMVLAEVDGKKDPVTITMCECIERKDTRFIKVVGGSSLEDLDLFLQAMKETARQQGKGK